MIMKINKRLILASKSPRRYDLLSPHFSVTEVVTCNVEEKFTQTEPSKIVEELAKAKLADLPQKFPNDIVISGDTIVWYNGILYGKMASQRIRQMRMQCLRNYQVNIIMCIAVLPLRIKVR